MPAETMNRQIGVFVPATFQDTPAGLEL